MINSNVVFENVNENSAYFIVEPLPKGLGATIGNSLRRTLLSYIEGYSVYKVLFSCINHEFATIPGVYEDVSTIVSNLRSVGFLPSGSEEKNITLEISEAKTYTAKDIDVESEGVKITTPNEYILTAFEKVQPFTINIFIKKGFGEGVFEDTDEACAPYISVAPIYSPINKVSYNIEDVRIGQVTDHDKLRMYVETNGSISPKDAVINATKIVMKYFSSMFPEAIESNAASNARLKQEGNYDDYSNYSSNSEENRGSSVPAADIDSRFLVPVEELDLSIRSENCIKAENINYIGDLVQKTESEMLRIPNFGSKSLREIKEVLGALGLSFGMTIDHWPPQEILEENNELN